MKYTGTASLYEIHRHSESVSNTQSPRICTKYTVLVSLYEIQSQCDEIHIHGEFVRNTPSQRVCMIYSQ